MGSSIAENNRVPGAPQVERVLAAQLALTLIAAVMALPFGARMALSVLVGGVVCLAANWAFAFWALRQYRAQNPGSILMRFYGAELLKLLLALGTFTILFITDVGLNFLALFAAYVAVQVLPAVLVSAGDVRKTRER